MKPPFKTIALLLLAVTISFARQTTIEFPKLTGPYLGQAPTGMISELFAPGIISMGYHEHRMAFSPDGNEIYFTVFSTNPTRAIIMRMQLKNGTWSTPAVASFSDSGMNLHPAFSADGKRIFFSSTRPSNRVSRQKGGADIWFVERQGDSWSLPENLGDAINSDRNESSPFAAEDGTLFFESNRNSDKNDWDIYFSRFANGKYQNAEKLPFPVNTEHEEGGPCVSLDGSFILFNSNRPGTLGEADIYVAFKKMDGTWAEPINLGEKVNSKFYDWAPCLTPDGNYIIFSSYRNIEPIVSEYTSYSETLQKNFGQPKSGFGAFYWLDAKIIAELKPKE